jgi:hypothetical protein
MDAQYLWSDVWILQAIIHAGIDQPAPLHSVIREADGLNHAMPTFQEIEGALARLTAGGLVVDSDGRFSPTAKAVALYRSVSNPRSWYEQREGLEKVLDALPYDPSISPADANKGVSYPWLTIERLKKAEKEYFRSMRDRRR